MKRKVSDRSIPVADAKLEVSEREARGGRRRLRRGEDLEALNERAEIFFRSSFLFLSCSPTADNFGHDQSAGDAESSNDPYLGAGGEMDFP